ncbi:MAG: hypothetical protein ACK4MU_08705 [Thermomonas sp.]
MTQLKNNAPSARAKTFPEGWKTMNQPPAPDARALLDHFADTYFSLRFGLAVLAVAFPMALFLGGRLLFGLELQPSMSAYFWAAGERDDGAYGMRTVFVGFLCAIGAGLYLYKGLTSAENLALNAAGLCAALVALFPADKDPSVGGSGWVQATTCTPQGCPGVHYGAAVLLFALLAYVAWACACKSLRYLPEGEAIEPRWRWLKRFVENKRVPTRQWFERWYRAIAITLMSVLAIGVGCKLIDVPWTHWLFVVEAAGIVVFGLYWLVKTVELSMSQPERDPEHAAVLARAKKSADGTPAVASPAADGR